MAGNKSLFEIVLLGKTDLGEVMGKASEEVTAACDKIKESFAEVAAGVDGVTADTSAALGGISAESAGSLEDLGAAGALGGAGVGRGLDDAAAHAKNFKAVLVDACKYATLGILGVASAVGAYAVDVADKFENANASLKAAVAADHESWGKVKDGVSAAEDAYTRFGDTATDVDSALALSVISTKNVATSEKYLSVAADLAAVKHESLADAIQVVDKAMTGNTRALKQLGIDLKVPTSSAWSLVTAQEAVTKSQQKMRDVLLEYRGAQNASSKDHYAYVAALQAENWAELKLRQTESAHSEILKALSDRLGGQASAAADTFGGHLKALHAEVENVAIKIGLKLIPILEKLVDWFSRIFLFIVSHKAILIALGVLVAGVMTVAFATWTKELYANAKGLVTSAKAFLGLGTTSTETASSVGASNEELSDSVTAAADAISTAAETIQAAFQELAEASWQAEAAGTSAFSELGATTTATAAEMSAAGDEIAASVDAMAATVDTGVEGMAVAVDDAAVAVDAGLGSTGIGAILIAVGIAATLLFTHWKAIWGWIKDAFSAAFNFIKTHLIWFAALFGPIGLAAFFLYKHWSTVWDGIKTVGLAVWHFIDAAVVQPLEQVWDQDVIPAIQFFQQAWDEVWGEVKTLAIEAYDFIYGNVVSPLMTVWDGIVTAVEDAFEGVKDAIVGPFESAVSAFESIWNSTIGGFGFTLPSWLGGFSFHIPKFGDGSSSPSGTAGTAQILSAIGAAASSAKPHGNPAPGKGGPQGGGSSGHPHVVMHVTINTGADPQAVKRALARSYKKAGSLPIRTKYNAAA